MLFNILQYFNNKIIAIDIVEAFLNVAICIYCYYRASIINKNFFLSTSQQPTRLTVIHKI